MTNHVSNLNRARVFVIGPGGHDYTPAKRFGDIIHILSSRINPYRTDELALQLWDVLQQHRISADDYVVFGGNAVLNAIAVAVVQQLFGRVRVLIYGAKNHDYTARDIEVKALVNAKDRDGW